jgi:hypothetical protein
MEHAAGGVLNLKDLIGAAEFPVGKAHALMN